MAYSPEEAAEFMNIAGIVTVGIEIREIAKKMRGEQMKKLLLSTNLGKRRF